MEKCSMQDVRSGGEGRRNFFGQASITAAALTLGAGLMLVSQSAQAAVVPAKKADALVDSIGVNIHLGYDDGVYNSQYATLKTRLQEMGIRHYRDGFENAAWKQYVKDRHNELGRLGIRGTFLAGNGLTPAQVIESANLMKDSVEAFEGQNEILNIYVGWDTAKRDAARQYQKDLFNTINASSTWQNYPILGPTCVGYDAYVALGDLSAWMDYGNAHAYPLGPAPAVAESGYFSELNGVAKVAPGKQIFVTETGYQTGNNTEGNQRVSLAASGKYAPRLYLENFNRGMLRSFWYELINQGTGSDQESNFGLLYNDASYKPSGAAIRNLTTLLKDATYNSTSRQWESPAFTPGSLDYTLSGNTTNVHTTLLQKSNGKFYLCLWQEVNSYNIANNVEADINNPNVNVTLSLATPVSSATAYYPTNGTSGTSLTISNNAISLSVPDHVMIVELTPGSSAIPIGKRIGFKAYNNKFVSTDLNNSTYLKAAWANTIDTWERFDVVGLGGNVVALKSVQTGKYVTCDLSDAQRPLRADWATGVGDWEKFTWQDFGNNVFALKSNATGRYVSSDLNTTDAYLKALWATSPDTWEKFQWALTQ